MPVTNNLSTGSHTVTARITDSQSHTRSLTRDIQVYAPGDTDQDGMDDSWERGMFGTLTRNGTGDFNNDGINDLTAYNNYVTLPRDGDANNNGETNMADQLLLLRHIHGYSALTDTQKARVDLYPSHAPDGKLTIQDLLLLQRKLLGLY